ncbi:MAG: glycosyltransferase family 2 protein [bacterium]
MYEKEVFEKYQPWFNKLKGPLVSIVTTAYKNEKFNEKYFNSVNNQTYKNIEVTFVDNLSPDNTVEDAKKRLKNGKIVISKINTGCAGGNNLGVSESLGKYIFLLGPDAWADKDCVKFLVEEAEENDNYIYAPRQMTYDGKEFISCGVATDLFGYPARTYTRDGRIQLKRVFYADGSGVFITKKNYLKVGGMDAETFLFAEDVDLSWKGHLIGMDVKPIPSALIYHYSGGAVGVGGYPKGGKHTTNANKRFLAERNIIRNILKNYKWWNVCWIFPFYLAINIFEILALVITGQGKAVVNSYFKAYFWHFKNIKPTLKKRREIQKVRSVGDLSVMKKMYFFPHKFYALLDVGIPIIK